MSDPARVQALVTGRVQGVFFRDFTRQKAQELGLTGYVRNLPNGAVEVLVEGERQAIQKLIGHLRQGPAHARVENISLNWEDYRGQEAQFSIKY